MSTESEAGKCLICGNSCRGKTCSGKCRAKLSRRTQQAHALGAHGQSARIIDQQVIELTGEEQALPSSALIADTIHIIPILTMHERQCAANNETRSKVDQHTINTGLHKSYDKLDKNEHNRVSLPGDDDYDGVVTEATVASTRPSKPSRELTLEETAHVFGGPSLETMVTRRL
jgi:hypothetical protein